MKRSGLALIITSVIAAFLIGCNSKPNLPPTAEQTKTGSEEAQKVADKFADLMISKCGDEYLFDRYPIHAKAIIAKVEPSEIDLDGHFYGYQFKSRVLIYLKGVKRPDGSYADGNNAIEGYNLFKRGGKWFFRPGHPNEGDVLVDDLQPIRPECPVEK